MPDHLKFIQGRFVFRDYWNFTSCLLWMLFRCSGVAHILVTQLFLISLLFTTHQFKMEQIYTIFCLITLFNLDSWIFNVINSSIIKNLTTFQELSRTPENAKGQQNAFKIKDITIFDTNSRKVLGAEGRRSGNLSFWGLCTALPSGVGSIRANSGCRQRQQPWFLIQKHCFTDVTVSLWSRTVYLKKGTEFQRRAGVFDPQILDKVNTIDFVPPIFCDKK